jgi:hypothetical protein
VFVQIMEFELDPQEAVRLLNEYAEAARGETYARRAMICADRNRPGVVHQLIFFDSVEEAELNNELEVTQSAAADFGAVVGEVAFTDLDLIVDVTI